MKAAKSEVSHIATKPKYPQPANWKVLVRPVRIEEKSKGGIILAPEAQKAKGFLRYFGEVVSMGPLCYQSAKFADLSGKVHAACKVGDCVAFGQYAGQVMRLKVSRDETEELRILNDDEVMAVVPVPSVLEIYCD